MLPPPPDRDEFEAELHALFSRFPGLQTAFAKWRREDKSRVSREVSPRHPDKSVAWLFLSEWLDPLYRAAADAGTGAAEEFWMLMARHNARYTQAGGVGGAPDALAVIEAIYGFMELLNRGALGRDVAEAELKDAGLRMLEVVTPFVNSLRHEQGALR